MPYLPLHARRKGLELAVAKLRCGISSFLLAVRQCWPGVNMRVLTEFQG